MISKVIDKTLARQLKKANLDSDDPRLQNFIQQVNETYLLHKKEMELANRAMRISSEELSSKNTDLKQAVSLSKDFSHIVAHNLREPIRTIISFSELINKKSNAFTPEIKDHLSFITEAGLRIDNYLMDLMEFLILEKYEYKNAYKVEENLSQVVANCSSVLDSLIVKNSATIICDKLPTVLAFPSHFDQLFINLMTNAMKFRSSQDPKIVIKSEVKNSQCIISFTDNGIGIPAQFQEQVFGVFQRLNKDIEGSGMGLAICKRIVQLYNGELDIESAPGRGTSIFVKLPESIVTYNEVPQQDLSMQVFQLD